MPMVVAGEFGIVFLFCLLINTIEEIVMENIEYKRLSDAEIKSLDDKDLLDYSTYIIDRTELQTDVMEHYNLLQDKALERGNIAHKAKLQAEREVSVYKKMMKNKKHQASEAELSQMTEMLLSKEAKVLEAQKSLKDAEKALEPVTLERQQRADYGKAMLDIVLKAQAESERRFIAYGGKPSGFSSDNEEPASAIYVHDTKNN